MCLIPPTLPLFEPIESRNKSLQKVSMPLLSSAQTNVHHRRFNNNNLCFSSDFTPLPRLFIKGHLQQLHHQQQLRQQQLKHYHRANCKQSLQFVPSQIDCPINFHRQSQLIGEEVPIELNFHSPESIWHRRKYLTSQAVSL